MTAAPCMGDWALPPIRILHLPLLAAAAAGDPMTLVSSATATLLILGVGIWSFPPAVAGCTPWPSGPAAWPVTRSLSHNPAQVQSIGDRPNPLSG
jgi:hypothetical protein